jgi:membrane-associated phospholipid phosphatase
MRLWQLASVVYFLYVALVAVWRSPEPVPVRKAFAGAAGGLILTFVTGVITVPLLNEWIWPPVLLLIGYWVSGLLFVAPSPAQEAALCWLDNRLNLRAVPARAPRWLAEVLESAYAGVYLLIPVALIVHVRYSPHPDPDGFWAVVLITDFICFAWLPWIQTRPPRALEPGEPWSSSVRAFNLRMLGATSINVNTFPSGHAAEALAAALLVAGAPPAVAVAMWAAAVAVSAGAVLGRYHYLVDAIAGWLVAVLVFLMIGI